MDDLYHARVARTERAKALVVARPVSPGPPGISLRRPVVSDLAEKIQASIASMQQEADEHHLSSCAAFRFGAAERDCDCTAADDVFRRCAADREILQRYRETLSAYAAGVAPLAMSGQLGAYEFVLRALARGYGLEVDGT